MRAAGHIRAPRGGAAWSRAGAPRRRAAALRPGRCAGDHPTVPRVIPLDPHELMNDERRRRDSRSSALKGDVRITTLPPPNECWQSNWIIRSVAFSRPQCDLSPEGDTTGDQAAIAITKPCHME